MGRRDPDRVARFLFPGVVQITHREPIVMADSRARYRVGVDIGGTFTDLMVSGNGERTSSIGRNAYLSNSRSSILGSMSRR